MMFTSSSRHLLLLVPTQWFDITHLVSRAWRFDFQVIKWESNEAANHVAKMATTHDVPLLVLDNPPNSLVSILDRIVHEPLAFVFLFLSLAVYMPLRTLGARLLCMFLD
ncbi:hypothetical protein GQ457_13G014040 [Hibiscus cannabinus]